ncbi:MAG TPA: YfiR family protein, partial [Nevskiaceae bacterium]|nr:YfiR family protein [Nevskiaceae bacterium]
MKPAAAAALAWAVRLLSALSLLFTSGPVLPQTALEQQVRAAFLYNFARFTSWPVERVADSAPIVFCTLEHEPLGAALASTLAGKSIDQHLLQVRVA